MLVKDDYTEALKAFLTEMGISSEDPEVFMKELKASDPRKIATALEKQNKVWYFFSLLLFLLSLYY